MTSTAQHPIVQRGQEFEAAFRRRDVAALVALYTDDAVLVPPDAPTMRGKQAIGQFWSAGFDVLRAARLRSEQIFAEGDTATDLGVAELDTIDGPATVRYIAVWKRSDGQWLMAADLWNNQPA